MTTQAPDALDREAFIDAMHKRFNERSIEPVEREYAVASLDAFLDMEGEKVDGVTVPMEFGHPDYDWSAMGASDLADEEVACWEFPNE